MTLRPSHAVTAGYAVPSNGHRVHQLPHPSVEQFNHHSQVQVPQHSNSGLSFHPLPSPAMHTPGQLDSLFKVDSELESARSLFGEKMKELSFAVAKVDALTRQLEELHNGNSSNSYHVVSSSQTLNGGIRLKQEHEKLRKDVMTRRQLITDQSSELDFKKSLLNQKKSELNQLDQRIHELHDRLAKKKLLNQAQQQQNALVIQRRQQQSNGHFISNELNNYSSLRSSLGRTMNGHLNYGNIKRPFIHPNNVNASNFRSVGNLGVNIAAVEPMQRIVSSSLQSTPKNEYSVTKQVITSDHHEDGVSSQDRVSSSRSTSTSLESSSTVNGLHHQKQEMTGHHHHYETTASHVIKETSSSTQIIINGNHRQSSDVVDQMVTLSLDKEDQSLLTLAGSTAPCIDWQKVRRRAVVVDDDMERALSIPSSNSSASSSLTSSSSSSDSSPDSSPERSESNKLLHKIVHPSSSASSCSDIITGGDATRISSPQVLQDHHHQSSTLVKETPSLSDPESSVKEIRDETCKESCHLSATSGQGKDFSQRQVNDEVCLEKLSSHDLMPSLLTQQDFHESSMSSGSDASPVKMTLQSKPESMKDEEKMTPIKGGSIHSSLVTSLKQQNNNLLPNKTNCSQEVKSRRVSFDPLALLLDAALEGELDLVKKTALQVPDPSAAKDEGLTALHNAICAGHFPIVRFLVEFGCDVNAQDSDGWTPLHCAASCNNLKMVEFLVEHGACVFATTFSDHETAAEKCEEDEVGYDGCSKYLFSVQDKMGVVNDGVVYAVYDYEAQNEDELSFKNGESVRIVRKGDDQEVDWWWSIQGDIEGYVPRNLFALFPRVRPPKTVIHEEVITSE